MNTENLKALVFGKQTTPYQRALALREFKYMTEHLELLEKAVNKNCNLQNVTHRFKVGDKVNYCNGVIFEIVKINEEAEVCYDKRGMWYALVNCKTISNGG